MAIKFWDRLKLKNGDIVKFVPPEPNGSRLGGVTQSQKQSISNISSKVDKSSLFDAGIKNLTWTTVRSQITVTTVEDIYKQYRPADTDTRYWAEFEGCQYFKNRQMYRVAFDGTVYDNIVCDYGILVDDGTGSVIGTDTSVGGAWQLIGNKHLYDSRYEDTNEPFCIMYVEHGGMHQQGSYYYSSTVGNGILLTASAKECTLKIEKAAFDQNDLPASLPNNYGFGDQTYQNIGNSTYPRTSIGQGNIVGKGSFAIGNGNISTGFFATSIGFNNTSSGPTSVACGRQTTASSTYAYSQGYKTIASGSCAHSQGYETTASNYQAHAQGYCTTASGAMSHAQGQMTIASGQYSHAQGCKDTKNGTTTYTTASGMASHAQGLSTVASGISAHSQGSLTQASGIASHAGGINSIASGKYSFANGFSDKSVGNSSCAFGQYNTANGAMSHAGGNNSQSNGRASFAFGNFSKNTQPSQFVVGYGNNPQQDSIFEIGNGLNSNGQANNTGNTEPTTRQNAFRVTQSGVAIAQTGLQIGSTSITQQQLIAMKTSSVNQVAEASQVLDYIGIGGDE